MCSWEENITFPPRSTLSLRSLLPGEGQRIKESTGLEVTSKSHLVQPPCSKQGHLPLHQVTQSITEPHIEYLQGWGLNYLLQRSGSLSACPLLLHRHSVGLTLVYTKHSPVHRLEEARPSCCLAEKMSGKDSPWLVCLFLSAELQQLSGDTQTKCHPMLLALTRRCSMKVLSWIMLCLGLCFGFSNKSHHVYRNPPDSYIVEMPFAECEFQHFQTVTNPT